MLILTAWLTTACTRYAPPDIPRDLAAEQLAAGLMQTNAGLTGFKCLGKTILSSPGLPNRSFRTAIAGRLPGRLRVDLLAPFGGAAGSFSSDGEHLFLVMHTTREYYKKRLGNGSLERFIQMDLTVADLLDILVGRIPMESGLSARILPKRDEMPAWLAFFDRWGNLRQQIALDDAMQPVRSVWFDDQQQVLRTLSITDRLWVDGFAVPGRIDMAAASGERIEITLDRCESQPILDDRLFVLEPPPT
ncbi:MAG: hypothetical protein WBY88_10110 [Desulfosarcina sp.]